MSIDRTCYHITMKAQMYRQRRKQVVTTMASGSILILAGNRELERTKDISYPFRQSNNFLYLTGINQPDAFLVIRKDRDQQVRETLYIAELHPFMAVWEGRTNHIQDITQICGIDQVMEYKEVEEFLSDLPQVIYVDMPDDTSAQIAAWQLWDKIKSDNPDAELTAINSVITELRTIKGPEEIDLIRSAVHETGKLLSHIRPLLVPGVTERAIAAEFVRAASEQGYEQSWPPIVSFGNNSCIIHHTPDDTKLQDGDLVLFDVGIEIEGYSSDISRMVQIGKSSDRQAEVLKAVQSVQADAIGLMKPGIKFDEFERQAAQIMCNKLVELGLFTTIEEANEPEGELQWPAYRRYFSHMTSHFLGLDAHDVGARDAEFAPGMVLTCEPGIYIAEEGIGVRVEDDILITQDGNQNLSAGVELDS